MIVGCLIDGIIPSCYLTSVFPILQTAQLALKERLNMPSTLSNATLGVGEAELSSMALAGYGLSEGLEGFQVSKDGYLDNATVAEHSFPGNTTGEISGTGRITGYIREFVTPIPVEDIEPGDNLMAATVVHLFDDEDQVSLWMANQFLGEFQRAVFKDLGGGQQLVKAEPTPVKGFADEAVGMCTVQASGAGLIGSAIVDFRIGRLLGVAYVVTMGDEHDLALAQSLGLRLEQNMIKVVLGSG